MTNLDLFLKGEVSLETAEAAHVEIHNLRAKLAKANERVRELEWTLSNLDDYLSDKNKFTIEKKVEALNAVKNEIKTVGGLELCDVVEFVDEQIEQLRKEQE